MKKHLPILLILVLLAAGCASKPETPEPVPAETISQAQLDELMAEASALRKKAFDLKLFEVMADDYKAADAQYVAGKTAYDAKDNAAAEPALRDAVAKFKDVLAKGVAALSEENRKRAEDMKALAVKTGAETTAVERLAEGDAKYEAAKALSAAGKDEEALVAFEEARKTYEAAYKKANALKLRGVIEEKEFAQHDAGNFQLAEQKMAESDALFAANPDGSLDALDEATLRYNLVIQKGWQFYAIGRKAPADEAKQRSEDIKAQVAVKDLYSEAKTVYDNAAALMAGGNYEEAGQEFDRAAELFDTAYAEAEVKRNAALAEMEAMEIKNRESESKAAAGDEILGSAAE